MKIQKVGTYWARKEDDDDDNDGANDDDDDDNEVAQTHWSGERGEWRKKPEQQFTSVKTFVIVFIILDHHLNQKLVSSIIVILDHHNHW